MKIKNLYFVLAVLGILFQGNWAFGSRTVVHIKADGFWDEEDPPSSPRVSQIPMDRQDEAYYFELYRALGKYQKENRCLRSERNEARTQLLQEVQSYQRKNKRLQRRNKRLRSERNEAREKLQKTEESLEYKKKRFSSISKKNAALYKGKKRVEDHLFDAKRNIENLEKEVERLRTQLCQKEKANSQRRPTDKESRENSLNRKRKRDEC